MSTPSTHLPLIQLPSGVPGLDEVLGGGIPEYSFSVIAGGPGTGKTSLAQQVLFANASSGRPGVWFAGPGEPARKLLRHQQARGFFEAERINRSVHVVNLPAGDPTHLIDTIDRELDDRQASFIVVDLARSLAPTELWTRLALHLARLEATSLLLGEDEPLPSAVGAGASAALSAADLVLQLRHGLDGEASVRTIQVLKVRGQQPLPGLHSLRLGWDGLEVFPRWPTPEPRLARGTAMARLSTGLDALDQMLDGGLPVGDAVLVQGPSGSGKSVLATHFLAEGGHQGEASVAFLFEERPDRFVARAEGFDVGLGRLVQAGLVELLSFRGRDLSADELIGEVLHTVRRLRARRVVLDSAQSVQLALSSGRGLRDCLWRLLDALGGMGVTVWLNAAAESREVLLEPLADDVLSLRSIERDGYAEHALVVSKTRWSAHLAQPRPYRISRRGLELLDLETHTSIAQVLADFRTEVALGSHG